MQQLIVLLLLWFRWLVVPSIWCSNKPIWRTDEFNRRTYTTYYLHVSVSQNQHSVKHYCAFHLQGFTSYKSTRVSLALTQNHSVSCSKKPILTPYFKFHKSIPLPEILTPDSTLQLVSLLYFIIIQGKYFIQRIIASHLI